MELKRLRPILLGIAAAAAPAVVLAQDGIPTQAPQTQQQQPASHGSSSDSQHDSSPAPGMTGQEMKDKIFLRKAAQGGLAEVKLGQLAAAKGASDDVKSFGSKMVADHTLINNEMKPVADSMGVRLPKDISKEDQAEYDRLNALSGEEFDREYITSMVKGHRKDLREFHVEGDSTNDAVLRAAIEKDEGVMREHMHMIMKLAKDKGINVPGPGRPTPAPTPNP